MGISPYILQTYILKKFFCEHTQKQLGIFFSQKLPNVANPTSWQGSVKNTLDTCEIWIATPCRKLKSKDLKSFKISRIFGIVKKIFLGSVPLFLSINHTNSPY
jgi:hypothetical protein